MISRVFISVIMFIVFFSTPARALDLRSGDVLAQCSDTYGLCRVYPAPEEIIIDLSEYIGEILSVSVESSDGRIAFSTCCSIRDRVVVYDPVTGTDGVKYLPISTPFDIDFGPDGNLYVVSFGEGLHKLNFEFEQPFFEFLHQPTGGAPIDTNGR